MKNTNAYTFRDANQEQMVGVIRSVDAEAAGLASDIIADMERPANPMGMTVSTIKYIRRLPGLDGVSSVYASVVVKPIE